MKSQQLAKMLIDGHSLTLHVTCFAKKPSVLFVNACMLQSIGGTNIPEITFFQIFFSFVFLDGWDSLT